MLDFKNHSTVIYRSAVLNTAEDFFQRPGFALPHSKSAWEGRGEGKARENSILNTQQATAVTFSPVHQPRWVSRCLTEILGDVSSHPPPPRLTPPSVFHTSYKALLPSLLSTLGSLGLPPSLWHFPEHPSAQGRTNVWTGFPGALGPGQCQRSHPDAVSWLGREGGSASDTLGIWRHKPLPCPAELGLKLLHGQKDREDNPSKSCWVSAVQWPQEGSMKW